MEVGRDATSLGLVEGQVLPQLAGLFLELGGEGLAARQSVLELLLALIRQPLLGFERLRVDVLTALARLPSKLLSIKSAGGGS
jgi:hypothetical protein